jgi:hypothetical protein
VFAQSFTLSARAEAVPETSAAEVASKPADTNDAPAVQRSADASVPARELTTPTSGADEGIHRQLWFVTSGVLGVQLISVAVMSALPNHVTQWGTPDITNIFRNFTGLPRFDSDPWGWNYVAHPISGAEYYLLARNRHANWWQSLVYSASLSLFWEAVTEGIYERWSYQDLLITPIAGAVFGELRYQLKLALIDRSTGRADALWKKILIVILDPFDAITGGRF